MRGFGGVDDACREGCVDRAFAWDRFHCACLERFSQLLRRILAGSDGFEGVLQRAERLLWIVWAVHAVENALHGRIAFGAAEEGGDFGVQYIRWPFVACAEREDQCMQQVSEDAVGEVGQHVLQRGFGLFQTILQRPAQQRFLFSRMAKVMELLERRGGEVEMAEHVAQAGRQSFATLEFAA